jgi:hypothetical protein
VPGGDGGMINVKPEILKALENNPALVALLGGKRIYQIKAPDPEEFPRITFFELTNFDRDFADDTAISSEIHVQIDIWSKESTSPIALEVDKTMKSMGYQRNSSHDFYEDDTQVFHKAMRYSTIKEVG